MGLARNYRGVKTLRPGPGGWYCHCCNPYSMSPRRMKPLARRLARRVAKHRLDERMRKDVAEAA